MAHLEGLSTEEVNDLIETILPPTDEDFEDEDFFAADLDEDEDEEDEDD